MKHQTVKRLQVSSSECWFEDGRVTFGHGRQLGLGHPDVERGHGVKRSQLQPAVDQRVGSQLCSDQQKHLDESLMTNYNPSVGMETSSVRRTLFKLHKAVINQATLKSHNGSDDGEEIRT